MPAPHTANRRRWLNADTTISPCLKTKAKGQRLLSHIDALSSSLRAHLKSQHTGSSEVYSCRVCYELERAEHRGNQTIHLKSGSVRLFRILIC